MFTASAASPGLYATCSASRTISPPIEWAMMLTFGRSPPVFSGGERADQLDQPLQRDTVLRECSVVEVVIAEDPQRPHRLGIVLQRKRQGGIPTIFSPKKNSFGSFASSLTMSRRGWFLS